MIKKQTGYCSTIFCLAAACLVLSLASASGACTIWAATGETVKGKGTIVAKNRDNNTELYTALKASFPAKGIPFYGIFDIEADGYVTAGINKRGLVIVNASANSVPRKKRHVATEDLTERLLVTFGSVDALLSDRSLFKHSHPAIYIVGDETKIASIEVAPGGKVAVSIKGKGVLAFTNHYTDTRLAGANERLSRGSLTRLARIEELLKREPLPYTQDGFIALSNDKDGGGDGSVWRSANGSTKIRTLASWIVYLPPKGAPRLYVKLANPNEAEKEHRLDLDELFWDEKEDEDSP